MLSNILELTLRKALSLASSYKHEYATYEHLLLALLDDKDAIAVLLTNKIDIDIIAAKLHSYIKEDLVQLVNEKAKEARPTAGFQRIIQRAALHSQLDGQKIVNGAHLLAEFYSEYDSFALACLKYVHLKKSDIIKCIKHPIDEVNLITSPLTISSGVSISNNSSAGSAASNPKSKARTTIEKNNIKDVLIPKHEAELEKYCVNLNLKANENSIDCLIGRNTEIQRTIEILCRRRKNNAILVGEPGVGKTAIAEGLAIRIIKNDVPDILKGAVIYSLDIGSLVAGTKFRGDFEERIKVMLECLKKVKNAILFIDEIHSIIGAGTTTTGALDASNLLKPALAKGELRCIGSTTFKEYHNHFEKDMALVRRFQKVIVEEPSEEATFNILKGLKGYYEAHHNVIYTDSALKAAINLSMRYLHDRHLPDKAIDLIDEAGSRTKTLSLNNNKNIITEKEIETLIVSILNIPHLKLGIDDIRQIRELEGKLKNTIFGQDEAIDSLCASIKLSKAGLKKANRPIGCYLFVGTTGVGKTELARQLALCCNMKLLKYDMSEFSEASSVSKLLGSAPGYVGFDQGGMLTSEVDKYPYSVILLDEIEKAHHEIYNLLLQIMDDGKLTDSTGKKVNFSHCIIILTSNVFVEETRSSIGFANNFNSLVDEKFDMEAINAEFSPEFRNRLDKIIIFNPIDEIVDKIVSKNIKELASQLADRKVRLTVSRAVKKYFAENCFSNKNGARMFDRVIDTEIKQYIADEILFGKLQNGGTVDVDYSHKQKKISFQFTEINKKFDKEIEISGI